MLVQASQNIGAGLSTFVFAGAGIGIGFVFSSLILGFALTEAIALFTLMLAFLVY